MICNFFPSCSRFLHYFVVNCKLQDFPSFHRRDPPWAIIKPYMSEKPKLKPSSRIQDTANNFEWTLSISHVQATGFSIILWSKRLLYGVSKPWNNNSASRIMVIKTGLASDWKTSALLTCLIRFYRTTGFHRKLGHANTGWTGQT